MKSRARVKVLLLTQQQKETRPKRVKATLNDLPEEMWPQQSPDLNPLDYSVQATLEKDATQHFQNFSSSFEGLSKKDLAVSDITLHSDNRLEAVICAEGGHTEKQMD